MQNEVESASGGEEKYEITYLCEEDKTVDVKKTLEENQAKIEKETDLGIRGLAYAIGKVTRARYFAIKFELEPSELIKIEKTLRLNKEIVRYLIVKNPPEAPIKTIKAPIPPPVENVKTAAETKEAEIKVEKSQLQPEAGLPLAEKSKTVEKKPEVKVEKSQPLVEKTEIIEEKPAKKIKKAEKKVIPRPQPKADLPLAEKADSPMAKKIKPVKISKDKLDEKLKELTLD